MPIKKQFPTNTKIPKQKFPTKNPHSTKKPGRFRAHIDRIDLRIRRLASGAFHRALVASAQLWPRGCVVRVDVLLCCCVASGRSRKVRDGARRIFPPAVVAPKINCTYVYVQRSTCVHAPVIEGLNTHISERRALFSAVVLCGARAVFVGCGGELIRL